MNLQRFLYLFVILILVSVHSSLAQYSLSGIVGGDTKETNLLEGVEIFIPEIDRFDVSKEGGTYIFKGIPPGVFHVQYSKKGYKTVMRTILIKDSATVVHVNLKSSSADQQDVVLGSKFQREYPQSFELLSEEDYKKSGSLNLAQALFSQPGLDIISEGFAFSKPVIRGFSANRIQMIQFGSRVENQSWYGRSSLGINDLGYVRTEIIKGPASLRYGADASGGVIIIKEDEPPVSGSMSGDVSGIFYSNTIGYDLAGGIKGMSESGILYGIQLGTESQTSYVQGAGSEIRKNTEDLAFAVNSKSKDQKIKAHVGASKLWGTSKLTYSYLHQQSGIIGYEDSVYNDPLRFNEIQREREVNLPYMEISSGTIASENTIITGRSNIKLNLAYQMNRNEEYETIEGTESKLNGLDLNSTTYDLSYNSDPLQKFGYTFGSQGIFQTNTNTGINSLIPDATMNSLGAFVLLRYDLKRFHFQGGARVDSRNINVTRYSGPTDSIDQRLSNFKRDFIPLSASLGLVYLASDEFSIKLNGSSGYSIPNYYQLYAYGLSYDSSYFVLGVDSLDYEQNLGLNLGFVWEADAITLGADFFYNQLPDHIHLANTGGYRNLIRATNDSIVPVYYFDQSNATMFGAELSMSIHSPSVKWLKLDLAYSMQRASLDNGNDLELIPADKVMVGLHFRSDKMNYLYNPYLKLVFSSNFEQTLLAPYEAQSPAYSLLDLHAGGDIKMGNRFISLSVSAKNILNESYSSHLSTLRYAGINDMGRNVAIRVSVPFGIMKQK
jgi:iron complex outermembrane receptor protein